MRSYFNADAYIAQLNASAGIEACDQVPLPEISGNQNYIFISYSHRDYKQVYADLAVMYHAGVRFWYDRGLIAGRNWDVEAKRIIENPHCVGVIFFLSENLFLSESVNKEIDLVRGSEEQARKNYFCVNLSNAQPSHILRNIMRMDDAVLDMAGLDMDRISVLANAFSDRMTYLRFSDPGHRTELIKHIASQFNVLEQSRQSGGYFVDKNSNEKILITENPFIIGRTKRKCHHGIEGDLNVSVVHFFVHSDADGYRLVDFGSMNGTYINGKRIKSRVPVPIHDLDEIAFGSQMYVFHLT